MGVIAAAALWTWNEISLGLVDIQQGVKELGRGKNVKMSKKYSLCIPGAAATCPSEVLKGGSAFLERCWALPGSALGALGQVLGWVLSSWPGFCPCAHSWAGFCSPLSWLLSLVLVLGCVLSPWDGFYPWAQSWAGFCSPWAGFCPPWAGLCPCPILSLCSLTPFAHKDTHL